MASGGAKELGPVGAGMAGSRPGRAKGQCILQIGKDLLGTGYWIRDTDYTAEATGYWILDTDYWTQAAGYLDTGYWMAVSQPRRGRGLWMATEILDTGH